MANKCSADDNQLEQALQQLQSAIKLLDSGNAPAQIAAHVDLAAHQLTEFIHGNLWHPQNDTNAEPH